MTSSSEQIVLAPKPASASRGRTTVTRAAALPWLVLAALAVVAFALVLRAGNGLTFYGDEWSFILHRRGVSPSVLLDTHNEHPVLIPVVAYKLMLQVFGLGSYRPYEALLGLAHVSTGVLMYLYARRRLGAWPALVPAALMLFLGAAWEDLVWAFQITFVGSVAFGLAMLVALDARRDLLACLALIGALTCSGLGLAFLVVAVVEIAYDPRRVRRAWVALVPAAVLAIILLGFSTGSRQPLGSVSHTLRWALDAAAAGFGAFGGVGLTWGRPMLIGAIVVVALAWRRRGSVEPRVVALILGACTYWFVTGWGRIDLGQPPDTSRYLYESATLLLALLVTVVPRPRLRAEAAVAVAGATALLCISGGGLLREGAIGRLANTRQLLPKLTALEVARGHAVQSARVDPLVSPDIDPASYYSAIDAFGSPAVPLPALRREPDDRRQDFDAALAATLGLQLTPAPAGASASGAPPRVEAATGGSVAARGACQVFSPTAPNAALDVVLAPGSAYRLDAAAGAPVPGFLRRIAADYGPAPALQVAPGPTQRLALPRDRMSDPWHLRLRAAQRIRVCSS